MAAALRRRRSPELTLPLFFSLLAAVADGISIGVNYGTKADNLPPPAQVAQFLAKRTIIDRVKLFDTNPDLISAFAGTGIALMITAGNGDLPALATRDGADAWVAQHIKPYYPATNITLVAVGNEIVVSAVKPWINNLVPAMTTLSAALAAAGFPDIRVSTPHSLGILSVSAPPSAARFRAGYDTAIFAPMLDFLKKTGAPFIVNPYPYFGYNGGNVDYALARPTAAGVFDAGTGITYTSMLDAQLDSVYSAMNALGYGDVAIGIGESGWPTQAEPGQIGVSPADAAEYNRYLIAKANAGNGTPLMPNRRFETYIFALFDEDLKDGPIAERNFGLFKPDFTPSYDVGLLKDGGATPANAPAPTLPPTAAPPPANTTAAPAPPPSSSNATATSPPPSNATTPSPAAAGPPPKNAAAPTSPPTPEDTPSSSPATTTTTPSMPSESAPAVGGPTPADASASPPHGDKDKSTPAPAPSSSTVKHSSSLLPLALPMAILFAFL